MKKSSSIIHILMSDYKHDSRVYNETNSLSQNGYDITVLCLKSPRTDTYELRGAVKIRRYGVFSGFIKMFSAYIGFIKYIYSNRADLIHAHDFTGYFIGYIMGRLTRTPVIYDSHELWSQALHRKRGLILSLAFRIERYIAQKARAIITVSEPIKQYMIKYFNNKNIYTVYNTPSYFEKQEPLDRSEHLTFIYQGLISERRGVGLIIEAVKRLKRKDFKVLFVGDGPYLDELKHVVIVNNLQEQIEVTGFIKQERLSLYTRQADIGIHCIPNSCLNHWYCLPNKLFEYIHADLVLLMSNMQELERVITEYEIGEVFLDGDVKNLADKMNLFLDNSELVEKYQQNLVSAQGHLNWDNEFSKLLDVYKSILVS